MSKGRLEAFSDGVVAILAAVGKDLKGKISPLLYSVAIPSTLASPWIAIGIVVALLWLVPDRRIESNLER